MLEIDHAAQAFQPRLAAVPEQLDRDINETMAANAAVMLARTQASAAQAEARQLSDDLEAERSERERLMAEAAEANKAQAVLERDKTVAEARTEEIRQQIEQQRIERSLMASRIAALEADRDAAVMSMSYWSKRRYQRRRTSTRKPSPAQK